MDLFRKEAVAVRKSGGLGSIRITPPSFGWISLCGAIGVLGGLLCLAVFGSYSRVETITGRLVPASGQSSVIAPQLPGGTIDSVLINEGDLVKRGQPLIKIISQRSSSAIDDTGEAISSQLTRKLEQLNNARDAQSRLFAMRKVDLRDRIGLMERRVTRLDAQISNQDMRYRSSKELYETWRTKAAGVVSGYQISQQYDTVLQQKSQAQDLDNQKLQLMAELAAVRAELDQLPETAREQAASIDVQIADVLREKAVTEQERDLIIRAQEDGVVASLVAHSGQAIEAGSTLAVILPLNDRLVAEFWVPSESVGLLRVGETVAISYEAFPAQRYGRRHGKIHSISTSALSASAIGALLGGDQRNSAYRVIVDLLPPSGRQAPLPIKPGMSLSAKVNVETRSLIKWVTGAPNSNIQIEEQGSHG